MQKNTPRGLLRGSSPEATAFDLAGYPSRAGGYSNVATLLAELAESLDPKKLLAETAHSPLPWTQRPGYLPELVGASGPAALLERHAASHVKEHVSLRPGKFSGRARCDARWRLLVNDAVEPDPRSPSTASASG